MPLVRRSTGRWALWLAFGGYVAVEIVAAFRHEPWFDELLAWNTARASATPAALISNIRYNGHPPVWYLLLWFASRITHSVGALHAVQLLAATGVAGLVLLAAPLRPLWRVMLVGGYYFLFEYGVLCRNYAVGVLLLFCLCIVQQPGPRSRPVLYYTLLFGLANVHFLFLLLAVALHVSVLWDERRRGTWQRVDVIRHAALGAALVLIPFALIQPPRDSPMVPSFWIDLWGPQNLFWLLVAPLSAFVPLPAWWRYHFWNTQVLLEVGKAHPWANVVAACASVLLVAATFLVIPKGGKARLFLAVSFVLCLVTALFFPLTSSARYGGVLFIAFVAALWISGPWRSAPATTFITSLLVVQAAAGLFALERDLRLPFSRSTTAVALAEAIPPGGTIVSDYNSLEGVSAYLDRPVYSLQQAKVVSFSKFDRSLDPRRSYADGLDLFFAGSDARDAFLFSPRALDDSRVFNGSFTERFEAALLGKYEGAIEPGSDLYLYRVARRPAPN